MSTILILHSDKIIAQGLELFIVNNTEHQVRTTNLYSKSLDSANFLQQLGETFVILAEGKLLDSDKCQQITKLDRAKLILCDLPANLDSLLLALNHNSSYISLEHNDPQSIILAITCVLMGSVFVCSQAKHQLNNCVFKSNVEQRNAISQLKKLDRQILVLTSQGYTYSQIGKMVNYSSLRVGSRLRTIVQKLNLQSKQEAIALAISSGLVYTFEHQTLQSAA
ncbi:MAG: hypothetical protein QNJ72_22885 [Pleurocapsa sp. MO_226.B13]|nr:hypothetical protein [Pleurocapsa sp. MO_226.B13]